MTSDQSSTGGNDFTPLAMLEALLNKAVCSSPVARQECGALSGKVLSLQFTDVGRRLYLLPNSGGIQLLLHYDGAVDVTLMGSTLALGRLGLAESAGSLLFSGQVTMLGDEAIGERFQQLLRLAAPDWEEELARFAGNVVAHAVVTGVRRATGFLRRSLTRLGQNTAEYLHYEQAILPDRGEVAEFIDDVDHLRDDAARLEARLQRLRSVRD